MDELLAQLRTEPADETECAAKFMLYAACSFEGSGLEVCIPFWVLCLGFRVLVMFRVKGWRVRGFEVMVMSVGLQGAGSDCMQNTKTLRNIK